MIDEDPLALIAELPVHDVDELRARRIRTEALAELARARAARSGVWRRAELALVGGFAAAYLVWAVLAATVPYR